MSVRLRSMGTCRRLLSTCLIIALTSLWLSLFILNVDAVDFYPLYFAAQRVLRGLSPYGADATEALAQAWDAPFESAGIVYPLPLILLMVPFALLPFTIASVLWIGLGIMLSLLIWVLIGVDKEKSFLLIVFLPYFRAAVLGQATLIWFGLSLLLITAFQRERYMWVGILSVVIALKPQDGLVFGVVGLWLAARENPKVILIALITGVVLWGGSLLIQPQWLSAWLAQINLYRSIVNPPTLLPLSLVLVLACWQLPWWGKVAAAQVALFPISDLYSALPLLMCWASVKASPMLILVGAGISWLWSLLGLPSTVTILWLLVLVPVILGAIGSALWEKFSAREASPRV